MTTSQVDRVLDNTGSLVLRSTSLVITHEQRHPHTMFSDNRYTSWSLLATPMSRGCASMWIRSRGGAHLGPTMTSARKRPGRFISQSIGRIARPRRWELLFPGHLRTAQTQVDVRSDTLRSDRDRAFPQQGETSGYGGSRPSSCRYHPNVVIETEAAARTGRFFQCATRRSGSIKLRRCDIRGNMP